jgi:hypothetical protein
MNDEEKFRDLRSHDTFPRLISTLGSGRPVAERASEAYGASFESRYARRSVTRMVRGTFLLPQNRVELRPRQLIAS